MSINKWSAYKLKYGFDDATEETLILKKKKKKMYKSMLKKKMVWWSQKKIYGDHMRKVTLFIITEIEIIIRQKKILFLKKRIVNLQMNNIEIEIWFWCYNRRNSDLEEINCWSTNNRHWNWNIILMIRQNKFCSWKKK